MAENKQHQQATPEHQPGALRRVLQRGHSGEGAHSVLELLRRRRDLDALGSPGCESPDPAADPRD